MSHVKRVKKEVDGSLRVLICTKWQYENCLTEEFKTEIAELANRVPETKDSEAPEK